MKRIVIILSQLFLVTIISFGQMKIANTGKVGIQLGTSTPLSYLSIGGVGNSQWKVSITGSDIGLHVNRTGTSSISWSYGAFGNSELTSSNSLGMRGQAFSSTVQNSGRSWGIAGYAGNATSGYNYGVMGTLAGTQNGAGIVGTINGSMDVNVPGKYAGYFVGDVVATGTVTATNLTSSDKRFKSNIEKIKDKRNVMSGIMSLNPVEYNLKQRFVESAGSDTAKVSKGLYDENSQIIKKKQFGLIAQEVREIYPDLVFEDSEGFLAINYTGIVPLLIEAVKELKTEVEELKKQIDTKKTKTGTINTSLTTE